MVFKCRKSMGISGMSVSASGRSVLVKLGEIKLLHREKSIPNNGNVHISTKNARNPCFLVMAFLLTKMVLAPHAKFGRDFSRCI